MFWRFLYSVTALLLCFPLIAFAVERAQVLPKGVNYLNLRTAQVGFASQKFDSSGALKAQGDFYTQNLDVQNLLNFLSPEKKAKLQELISALNQSGRSDLGDKMHPGQLKVDIEADVKYIAPIYAHGISERLTLAIALPVIQYGVDVRFSQINSNISQIKSETQTLADASGDLKEGLDTLDHLTSGLQDVLAVKGYRPIRERRKETFLADIQVVGLYQLYRDSKWASVLKTTVVLPTGPQDHPDDLTDITSQHQTALGLTAIQDYSFTSRTTAGLYAGYHARIPDQSEKRVPSSESDVLPDEDRKETLYRDLGDTVTLGMGAHHSLSDEFVVSLGWEWAQKQEDKYRGGRSYNYELLARNTYQESQRGMAGLEYSTVQGYLKKQSSIPYAVSYDFSDTLAGRNIERSQIHELALKMYF